MFVGGERPGGSELVVVFRTVHVVSATNDHIVSTREKTTRLVQQFLVAEFTTVFTGSSEFGAHNGEHMFAALWIAQVFLHERRHIGVHLKTVVSLPIVIGDDFKQVGYAPKFRDAVV